MAVFSFEPGLGDRLPSVRGKLTPNGNLSDQTWFRVGGPAEILFRPADSDDLAFFLEHCPPEIPVTTLGAASNVLIRDGGIAGVVVRLGPSFATISSDGDTVRAGAASIDLNVARASQNASLTGLEFLCGIPGTIGGGLRMNAGAYGREFKDIVVSAEIVERNGTKRHLRSAEIGFSYRHTTVDADLIFVSALLQGAQGSDKEIADKMTEIQKSRADTQPIREKTGGSTFANPQDDIQRRKSWQLIEEAGCRGLQIGNAKVSEKHCNFLINMGQATATEIEHLGNEVQRRVLQQTGILLRWEIKRLGAHAPVS